MRARARSLALISLEQRIAIVKRCYTILQWLATQHPMVATTKGSTFSHFHFPFFFIWFIKMEANKGARIIIFHANFCCLVAFLPFSFRICFPKEYKVVWKRANTHATPVSYLYPCHSGSKTDRRVKHRLDSKAHIDYSIDLNAMEMRRQHTNIDRDRYRIGTIHGTFCRFASLDRRIVNLNIPYINRRQACNELDMKCMPMDRLLFY